MSTEIALVPDLEKCLRRANAEHQLAGKHAMLAVEHARKSGEALLQIKSLLGHGKFLPWLKEHFEGSSRTARAYMQIASNWQSSANFDPSSLAGALASLKPAERSAIGKSEHIHATEVVTDEVPSSPPSTSETELPVSNEPLGDVPVKPAENPLDLSKTIQGLLDGIEQPVGLGRVALWDILRYCCRRLSLEVPRDA